MGQQKAMYEGTGLGTRTDTESSSRAIIGASFRSITGKRVRGDELQSRLAMTLRVSEREGWDRHAKRQETSWLLIPLRG